jgi:hypothetical protein
MSRQLVNKVLNLAVVGEIRSKQISEALLATSKLAKMIFF